MTNTITTIPLATVAIINDVEYYSWIDMSRGILYIRRKEDHSSRINICNMDISESAEGIEIERHNNRHAFTLEVLGGIPDEDKIVAIINAFFGEGKHTISKDMWNYILSEE